MKLGSDDLSTADDIITAPMTVAPGEDDAEISGTDGTVTATDYHFGVDVAPDASTLTFNNDSDTQFHLCCWSTSERMIRPSWRASCPNS